MIDTVSTTQHRIRIPNSLVGSCKREFSVTEEKAWEKFIEKFVDFQRLDLRLQSL